MTAGPEAATRLEFCHLNKGHWSHKLQREQLERLLEVITAEEARAKGVAVLNLERHENIDGLFPQRLLSFTALESLNLRSCKLQGASCPSPDLSSVFVCPRTFLLLFHSDATHSRMYRRTADGAW